MNFKIWRISMLFFMFLLLLVPQCIHADVLDDVVDLFSQECLSFNLEGERLGGSGSEHIHCCHIPGGIDCQIEADNYATGIGNYMIGLNGSVSVTIAYDLPFMSYTFDGAVSYDFLGRRYDLLFDNLTYKYLGFYVADGLKCANQISGNLTINDVFIDKETLEAIFCKPSAFLLW